jgi:hypothetical protein
VDVELAVVGLGQAPERIAVTSLGSFEQLDAHVHGG